MSVIVLPHEEALAISDEAQAALPQAQIVMNFFEHFGTTGCMLDCEHKKTQEAEFKYNKASSNREKARSARKSHAKEFCRTRWFTGKDLVSSKRKGCGSCDVLSQILSKVFHQGENMHLETCKFSVAPSWELKAQQIGGNERELSAQLFQYQSQLPKIPVDHHLTSDRCQRTFRAHAEVEPTPWTCKIFLSVEAMDGRMFEDSHEMRRTHYCMERWDASRSAT